MCPPMGGTGLTLGGGGLQRGQGVHTACMPLCCPHEAACRVVERCVLFVWERTSARTQQHPHPDSTRESQEPSTVSREQLCVICSLVLRNGTGCVAPGLVGPGPPRRGTSPSPVTPSRAPRPRDGLIPRNGARAAASHYRFCGAAPAAARHSLEPQPARPSLCCSQLRAPVADGLRLQRLRQHVQRRQLRLPLPERVHLRGPRLRVRRVHRPGHALRPQTVQQDAG